MSHSLHAHTCISHLCRFYRRTPQLVLDEPTTGIDPSTRRLIWDFLLGAMSGSKRGMLVTTHSMEEADALCTHLAIMVAGSIRTAGSPAELKSMYSDGLLLSLTVTQTVNPAAERECAERIALTVDAAASLVNVAGRTYKFLLPGGERLWTHVFGVLQVTFCCFIGHNYPVMVAAPVKMYFVFHEYHAVTARLFNDFFSSVVHNPRLFLLWLRAGTGKRRRRS